MVGKLPRSRSSRTAPPKAISERRATPRRVADQELQTAVAKLRGLLGAITDVVLILDNTGRYLEVISTTPNLLYRSSEKLINKTLHEIFESPQADELLSYIRRSLYTGDNVYAEYCMEIDGRIVWFAATVSPMTDTTVVWVARDITERKVAEKTSIEQTTQMEVVLRTSLSLTANLNLPDLLDNVLQSAIRLVTGAKNAYMFFYDAKQGRLSFGNAILASDLTHLPLYQPRPNGLNFSVAQQGEMIVVPHMKVHPLFINAPHWAGAIVGLPIKIANEVVGVMNVSFHHPHDFTPSELRALRLLGDQAAVAIQNSRLFAAERTARAQAEALTEVAHIFTTNLDLSNLLQLILEQLARVVQYDTASVMLHSTSQLTIVAARGIDVSLSHIASLPISELAHLREVIEERHPVVITNTRLDPRWLPIESDPPHSWLGLPLVVKDRVIGVLNLDNSQLGFYNDFDSRLALTFASQAAVAIENARLFESISNNAQEMWRASDILQSLNTVFDVLHAFPHIAEGLKDLTASDRVTLWLLDERHRQFSLVAENYSKTDLKVPPYFSITATSAYSELINGRVYFNDDLFKDRNYPIECALYDSGFRSRILVPLRAHDQIIGALSFLWQRPLAYHNTNIKLLTQMADTMALAIEKSRLYEETRRGDLILQALAYVSRKLLMPGDLDEKLQDVIAHLGRATNTSFAYFFENHQEEDELKFTMQFIWSSRTDKVSRNPVNYHHLSYKDLGIGRWKKIMANGGPIYGLIRDFSPQECAFMIEQKILSFALVPIFVGDMWWGFIGFSDLSHERQWYVSEVESLKSVAGAFGAAFGRQKIEAAERQQRALIEALRDGAALLNSTLNLDEVLDRILEIVRRVTPHDAADVMLYDESTQAIRVARSHGYEERGLGDWIKTKEMILQKVPNLLSMATHLRPFLIADVHDDPDWIVIPETAWIRSYISAPIHSKGQLIGFLNLLSTIPSFFVRADVERLRVFADQAAVALENARLYRVTEQNALELASLYQASSELLNPGKDIKALALRAAQIVTDKFNSAHCGVLMLQESTRDLRLLALSGDARFNPPDPISLEGKGLIAMAARLAEPIYAPDVLLEPNYLLGNVITRSEFVVPLMVNGRTIGILDVESPDLDAFDESARRIIGAFAEQVALAMENVRLVSRLELARETAEEANQVKSQFLANTSHELRTPLTGIIGSLSMVMDGLCDTREEERECVQIAYTASQRLLNIINSVLDVAKIESGHMDVHMQDVDIGPLFADVYSLMRIQADEKKIKLDVSFPDASFPKMRADPDMVRQILLNLVGNAMKFTHKGGITILAVQAGSYIDIIVSDTGIGIPLSQQSKLFQPFVQVDGSMSRPYGGTGLGLSISRKLVEMMGGTIALFSEGEGKGSRFTVSLMLSVEARNKVA